MDAATSPDRLFGLDDRSQTLREPLRWAPPSPTPESDLPGWLDAAIAAGQAGHALCRLRALRHQPAVIGQALRHLAASIRRADDDWESRVLAVAAVGVLEARSAAPLLERVCRRAATRLARSAALPAPEIYCALTVLESLRTRCRFDLEGALQAYAQDVEAVDQLRDPRPALEVITDRFRWRLATVQAAGTPLRRYTAVLPRFTKPDRRLTHRLAQHATFNQTTILPPVIAPSGALPWPLRLAALIAVIGALVHLVVGLRIGGLFGPMAVLWVASAIAVLLDRRETWMGAVVAHGLNGAFLLSRAVQPQPWLSSLALMLGGVFALGVVALLLMPSICNRYLSVRPPHRARFATLKPNFPHGRR